MSNFALGYENQILLGTLAASSGAPGLGVSQLQNEQGNAASAWQSTSASVQTITITTPAWTEWQAFGLFRTNLTPGATVSVTVRNGGSGGTIVLANNLCSLVPGYGQMLYVAAVEVLGDWCQFSINDTGNTDGFYNVPLAFAGSVEQFTRNMSYQSVPSRSHSSATATTRAGGVIVRTDWTKRVYALSLSGLLDAELQYMAEVDLAGRQGNNVLFVPNPASALIGQEAIFGQFEPSSGFTYPYSMPNARGYSATITERL